MQGVVKKKDIKELIRITLPLLDKKYADPEVERQALNTVSALASYKTFADARLYLPDDTANNICKDGQANLGGVSFKNKVFANCTIHYLGGDITLKNVSFINTEFDIADGLEARKFLTLLLLSDKPTITLDTSSQQPAPSE